MKKTFLLILLFTSFTSIRAIETINWIIKNDTIGSNIIYRPNDYIFGEQNYPYLVITGNIGDKVVSPVDGTITSVSYGYMFNLQRTHNINTPITKLRNDSSFRKNIAKDFNNNSNVKIDAKYVHYRITITTKEYGNIHLQGIINPSQFITGQKIKKGDIIGEIGYCYHKIEQPNLMISRTVNNRNADPMSIFGLKSTFKAPVVFTEKSIYQPTELKEDFQILRDAILEGYPGLNDYISMDSLLSLYNILELTLTTPKTKEEFNKIVQRYINPLRDDHFDIINKNDGCHIKPSTEFYFGVQSNSLIVIRCLKEYKKFLGKKIVSIDGIPSKELIRNIKSTIPIMADGYNTSRMDDEMLTVFWSYFERYYKKEKGDSLVFQFNDGTEFRTTYKMHSIYDYTRFSRNNNDKNLITTKIIQDSIAYLDVNTFDLFEQTENEIKQFIDSLNQKNINYLIIDVRYNPGGHENSMTKLYSLFANSSFKTSIIQKVTSNKPFLFSKNTKNLISEESIFPEYIHKKGKYYYLPDSLIVDYIPDSGHHYNGHLFILTNAYTFSAASCFAALFKKYGNGVIIGQETGGNYCHMNAYKFANIHLPNTNTEILMPLVQVVFDEKINSSNPWGRGVMPDLRIPLTIDLFIDKEDNFLANALGLIKNYDYKLKKETVIPQIYPYYRLIIILIFIGLIIFVLIVKKLRHTTRANK